jgi:hypothetical protein
VEPETLKALAAAEEAVLRLIDECAKQKPLYDCHPKAVAQVSRTAKWLINALATLHRILYPPAAPIKPSSAPTR